MAIGLGARVMVMDRDADVMRFLDATFESRIETVFSTKDSIEKQIQDAALVVGGVLIPGAAAPKLVSRRQLSLMKPGAVVVDVAISMPPGRRRDDRPSPVSPAPGSSEPGRSPAHPPAACRAPTLRCRKPARHFIPGD